VLSPKQDKGGHMVESYIKTLFSVVIYFCCCSMVIGFLLSRVAKSDVMNGVAFLFAGTGMAGLAAYLLTFLGRISIPH
jgi:small-conductance mechanosensitive channel